MLLAMTQMHRSKTSAISDLVWYTRPMKTVNMYEAKTQLSKLVEEALRGEEIVIAKSGVPQVKLVPLRKRKRSDGFGKGKHMLLAPIDWEDFDAPLEEFAEYM